MVAIRLNNEELKVGTRRRMLPGPESTLLIEALSSGIPVFNHNPDKLFLEFEMPTGYPDILAIYSKANSQIDTEQWSILSKNHLRVLHHIYMRKSISVEELISSLLFNKREIEKIISELERRNLLRIRSKLVSIRSASTIFPLKKIIAIEVKVKDWRGCLKQAELNNWFASESYMLLPEQKNVTQICAAAEKSGSGVLFYDGKHVRLAKPSRKNKIPASFGSWLLVGA